MRISHSEPGGSDWSGSRPRLGLCHGFLYNLCTAVSSCFYVFCCCWLIEDCFVGRRSFGGPSYGSMDQQPPPPPPPYGSMGPPPPPPPHIAPSHGLLGAVFGPPGPPHQPGPAGYHGEPSPF